VKVVWACDAMLRLIRARIRGIVLDLIMVKYFEFGFPAITSLRLDRELVYLSLLAGACLHLPL